MAGGRWCASISIRRCRSPRTGLEPGNGGLFPLSHAVDPLGVGLEELLLVSGRHVRDDLGEHIGPAVEGGEAGDDEPVAAEDDAVGAEGLDHGVNFLHEVLV